MKTAKPNEIRALRSTVRAIPASGDVKARRIGGVIPFNSQTELLCDESGMSVDDVRTLRAAGGCFREVIAPGAFNFTDVRALAQHHGWPVYGRTTANTLRINQKDDGLHYELDVPDSPSGADLYTSIERGDVAGVSFDFNVRDGGEEWDFRSRPPVRTLRAIDISEISFVGTPAYAQTSAATRSMVANAKTATRTWQAGESKEADALRACRLAAQTCMSACDAVISKSYDNAAMRQQLKQAYACWRACRALLDAEWDGFPQDEFAELVAIGAKRCAKVVRAFDGATSAACVAACTALAEACDAYSAIDEPNETIDDDADDEPAATAESDETVERELATHRENLARMRS
ncbi:MAG: HK97 family phage prohead protease [Phycisphaerales bacterium]|nr:HK97 family phage prohead protease [Phycisphaerales bacterium]